MTMPQGHVTWQWPEAEDHVADCRALVEAMSAPYRSSPPPMCYPGTSLDPELARVSAELLQRQINAIGTHTHLEQSFAEQGFEQANEMEREAIFMIADAVTNHANEPPRDTRSIVDGYFCGGGTEANDMGLWIGRQYLRQHPDPFDRGIAVLCTPLTHYSIHKAAAKLDIGQSQWTTCPRCAKSHIFVPDPSGAGVTLVGMNASGEMDVGSGGDFGHLERIFRLKYEDGFRRFLIVATAGTTAFGSIDPVERIAEFIRMHVHRETLAHCYLHVDAAIGGFTIPFAHGPGRPWPRFAFDIPEVMSVTLDGDKMGQLPYPAGIVLCRKHLQRLVARQVMYIGGHEDDTFSGSRTCVAPVLAWMNCKRGRDQQRAYVQQCLIACAHLQQRFTGAEFAEWVTVHPWNGLVNILPVELRMDGVGIPEGHVGVRDLLLPYTLRHDDFPGDPEDPTSCTRRVYKLCIWPHTIPFVDRFADDLLKAKRRWDAQRA